MTTNQKLGSAAKLGPISNMGELQAEAKKLKQSVRSQEGVLREHLKQLPKEAVKAGMGTTVPKFLTNKVAGAVLGVGTAVLGNYLAPKATSAVLGGLLGGSKKEGLAGLAEMAINWFKNRKKAK